VNFLPLKLRKEPINRDFCVDFDAKIHKSDRLLGNWIIDNYGNRVYEVRGNRVYDIYGSWLGTDIELQKQAWKAV
jgi:hypothetical protein